MAGQKDVFASLGHRTVGSADYEDCAVHLSGARNHVLNEVCVSGAVDVRIVARGSFILYVRYSDCNSLGGVTNGAALCDVLIGLKLSQALVRLNLQDCGRECSFTVVDVTNSTYVYMWFRSDE